MSQSLVVDASVAIKWLLQEPGSEQALAILEQGCTPIAPDLVSSEIGNVLWKKSCTGKISQEVAILLLQEFERIAMRIVASQQLATLALGIAQRCDRSYYDSLYLALAEQMDVPLVTADTKFWNALQGGPYRHRVVQLETLVAS